MDFSRDEDSSGSYRAGCSSGINIALFIPGIIIVAVAIIDMIVLFVVPTLIAKNNKKKFPDSKFESPNKVIIAFHFLEHIFLMSVGIILIIMSIFDFGTTFMIWGPTVAGILFLICYIVQLYFGFKKTRSYTSQLNVEQMRQFLSLDQPIETFYFYTEGDVIEHSYKYDSDGNQKVTTNTYTCYSKNGYALDVKSTRKTPPYNFTDVPGMFYFNLYQNVLLDSNAANCYNFIVNDAKKCTNHDVGLHNHAQNARIKFDKYPLSDGTFLISQKKIPAPMTKASRTCSILFGASVFYEIYTKSIPYIDFTMDVDVYRESSCESVSINCDYYGRCSRFNKKPTL